MKIYIEYKEKRSGGEAEDESDRWSSRADTNIDYKLVNAYLQKPESCWYFEEFDVECEETPKDIYAVVVRYQDGDTFGTSYGNGCIEGVYLDEDTALKVVEFIENDTYKEKYARWNQQNVL
jgi:hypothetical protein